MTSTSPRVGRRTVALGAATVCAVLTLSAAVGTTTATAGTTNATAARTASGTTVQPVTSYNPTNPLAGRTWGVAKDSADQVYPHYQNARGVTKTRLARIALTPRVRWFGAWQKPSSLNSLVGKYILATKADGGANTVVQAAVFRLVPNEAQSCGRIATSAEVSAYKSWITAFARAINAHIGTARMMIDLEPDLPHWECSPRGSKLHRSMTAYSARVLEAAKNTSVYIDAGASDWRSVSQAVSLLKGSGIQYTRGFILNNTHYTTTSDNINHGYALVGALARAGLGSKHFTLNTSNNGWGFTHAWYYSKKRSAPYDNAPTCSTAAQRGCVTLGIPATTNVAKSTWGLSKAVALKAAKRVDGYVWSGRSWLTMQSHPFNLARALNMAKTGRYMGSYPTR